MLADDWGVSAEVWSVTSFCELAREAQEVQRWNRLHPQAPPSVSHLARCLAGDAPVVAATDYVRAYPQLIAGHVSAPYITLGTDGFGRSDTRMALRRFFEVDRHHVVVAALHALVARQTVDASLCQAAIERYGLAADAVAPWRL